MTNEQAENAETKAAEESKTEETSDEEEANADSEDAGKEESEEADSEPVELVEEEDKVEPEFKVLFGEDVSGLGLDFPASNHPVAYRIRKFSEELDQRIYSMTEDGLPILAQQLQVLLNRVEERFAHRAEVYEAKGREEAAAVLAERSKENARRAANKEKHQKERAAKRLEEAKKRQGLI